MPTLAPLRFGRAELAAAGLRAFAREFDAEAGLVGVPPYFTPPSIGYARLLLERGEADDVALAEAILTRIFTSHELRPDHPDHGHAKIRFNDETQNDLNGIQLNLIALCPLMIAVGDRLSPAVRAQALTAIRAGLHALNDIDAALSYSNVAVLDVANRILGGQILQAPEEVERGVAKFDALLRMTWRSGGLRGYNSPTYLGQMLMALATLANDAADPLVRRRSEFLQERIWLQAAVHYIPALAQFAGPYSRAYPPDILGGPGMMKSILYGFLDDERLLDPGVGRGATLLATAEADEPRTGTDRLSGYSLCHLATHDFFVPAHVLTLFTEKPLPFAVREGADREAGAGLTTFIAPSHALGVADRGFGSQTRNLLVHAALRHPGGPAKIVFSRFLAHGDPYDLNIFDKRIVDYGPFAGLQAGRRAIALAGTGLLYRRIDWLGWEVRLLGSEAEDVVLGSAGPVRLGDRLPAEEWLVLDLGAAYVGLYPLAPTHLGGDRARPVSIVEEEGGALLLRVANYEGPARHFWKYASIPWEDWNPTTGPFFHGNVHAGMLIEAADAADWSSAAAFRKALAATAIGDEATDGVRRVTMERDGASLALAVDLCTFEAVERAIDGVPAPHVGLQAPGMVQFIGEETTLDGTSARCSVAGPWVIRLADRLRVTNPTAEPAIIEIGEERLTVPPYDWVE